MDQKSLITKSKSSNSTITSKLNKNNKKCKSNGEFQPHEVKKRGVYVEKRPTTLSIHNTDTTYEQDKKTLKQIPKARPGSKKFVSSVLSILSKSTRGTQYPDELKKEKKQTKSKPIAGKAEISNGSVLDNPPKTKLKKFKSKDLNNIEANKKFEQEHLLVLKSKKDSIDSSSNYSYTNSFMLPEVSSFFQNNHEINLQKNDLEATAEEVGKDIKRKKRKVDKKVRIDDPVTLVEDTNNNQQEDVLYGLFLDIIGTNFSDHNIKDNYNSQANMPSAVKSNLNLEIEESVFKKLNVKKNPPEMFDDITQKPRSRMCCVKDDNLDGSNFFDFIKNTTPYRQKYSLKSTRCPIRQPARSKLKTQSFTNPNNKRSFSNTFNKKTILNEFKEQLKMDLESLEEPQNFYQALKTMAKNKRKHQDGFFTGPNKYSDDKCALKRRKIISSTTKLNKNKRQIIKPTTSMRKYIDNINSRKYNITRTLKKEDSNQSLEVYSYDHDVSSKPKDAVYDEFITSPCVGSPMESQMNIDALLKYTESDFSKNMRSVSQNLKPYELDG